MYTQLVQALGAAQSPLNALAVLEVKFCMFIQAMLPVTTCCKVRPMTTGPDAFHMYNMNVTFRDPVDQ